MLSELFQIFRFSTEQHKSCSQKAEISRPEILKGFFQLTSQNVTFPTFFHDMRILDNAKMSNMIFFKYHIFLLSYFHQFSASDSFRPSVIINSVDFFLCNLFDILPQGTTVVLHPHNFVEFYSHNIFSQ